MLVLVGIIEDDDVFLPPRRYDYYVADENYVWVPIRKLMTRNYWDNNQYL